MRDPTPLVGEPLALDLVNTRPHDAHGPVDLLATPRLLASWLALQADRFPELTADAGPTTADLPAVHAVREHAGGAVRALLAGDPPPPSALDGLNRAQRAAPAVWRMEWEGTRNAVTATPHREGSLGTRLAAVLAEATRDLITGPAIGRVRQCEAEDCVLLYLPAHPRRRWCSPARCGNRARVARYYQRHKAT